MLYLYCPYLYCFHPRRTHTFFVRSGGVRFYEGYTFAAGTAGYDYTNRAAGDNAEGSSYVLDFNEAYTMAPKRSLERVFGLPLRCLVR